PMNVEIGDFELTNLGQNASNDLDVVIDLANAQLVVQGNTTIINMAGVPLESGVYQLRVGETAESTAGIPLDGDNDGAAGGDFVLVGDAQNRLYVQIADFNGDQGTSVFDFSTFSYWFGVGIPLAPAYADLNGDAGVSVFDFSHYSANFGQGVIFPAAAILALNPILAGADFVDDEVAGALVGQFAERNELDFGWADPLIRVALDTNRDKMFDGKLEIGYFKGVDPLELDRLEV
ncbi:MAG: hypothetical protein ACI9G1_003766, partial [Pirellulaceae bacterium]